MTPENKQKLLSATREAARALLEDVSHLREVLARTEQSPAELRRLSTTVRRLLTDGELSAVAAPRIGRIKLTCPNNDLVHAALGSRQTFFCSGGVRLLGMDIRGPVFGQEGINVDGWGQAPPLTLNTDRFLKERVICLNGEWVSRGAVITYVANVTSGAHTTIPKTAHHKLLARVRAVATYQRGIININFDAINTNAVAFSYSTTAMDPVLVELLAAIHCLVSSSDTHNLESVIAQELQE